MLIEALEAVLIRARVACISIHPFEDLTGGTTSKMVSLYRVI